MFLVGATFTTCNFQAKHLQKPFFLGVTVSSLSHITRSLQGCPQYLELICYLHTTHHFINIKLKTFLSEVQPSGVSACLKIYGVIMFHLLFLKSINTADDLSVLVPTARPHHR
jgi:hypothetical protein